MPHQEIIAEGLRAFFERFQSLSAASDLERIAAMYAGSVMIAGPNGAQVVSSTDLKRAIPKRRQLLESVGYQDTALVGFEESALTDRYALVRAQFRWHFQPASVFRRQVQLKYQLPLRLLIRLQPGTRQQHRTKTS